ncbi:MAG: hypothetical protein RBT65_16750 [Methanolobus sp.]|nr:hypothetical protein [Methanolobus sp.]
MNNALLSSLNQKIASFHSLQVVEGYYLVLGGGKIGNDFLRYAKERSFPFVVVIDIDEAAEASNNSIAVERKKLLSLIGTYKESKESESNAYFHCMDVRDIPLILEAGIPEYIIPAVPTHALANMAIDLLGSVYSRPLISDISIKERDEKQIAYFHNIISELPEEIVVFNSHSDAVIMLSYAKMGEICPDNCLGAEKYCYNFNRKKPETITAYVRELLSTHKGWMFESYQMKPGIGGIKGIEFKEHLLSIMEHVNYPRLKSVSLSFYVPFKRTEDYGIVDMYP